MKDEREMSKLFVNTMRDLYKKFHRQLSRYGYFFEENVRLILSKEDGDISNTIDKSIYSLGLRTTTQNILYNHDIWYIFELIDLKPKDLLEFNNIAKKRLGEIKASLEELGLNLMSNDRDVFWN